MIKLEYKKTLQIIVEMKCLINTYYFANCFAFFLSLINQGRYAKKKNVKITAAIIKILNAIFDGKTSKIDGVSSGLAKNK